MTCLLLPHNINTKIVPKPEQNIIKYSKVISEDYVYSAELAKMKELAAVLNGVKVNHCFFNGKEYTVKGRTPFRSGWNDAVVIAVNVPEKLQ